MRDILFVGRYLEVMRSCERGGECGGIGRIFADSRYICLDFISWLHKKRLSTHLSRDHNVVVLVKVKNRV